MKIGDDVVYVGGNTESNDAINNEVYTISGKESCTCGATGYIIGVLWTQNLYNCRCRHCKAQWGNGTIVAGTLAPIEGKWLIPLSSIDISEAVDCLKENEVKA